MTFYDYLLYLVLLAFSPKEARVEAVFRSLTDEERVAQMLVTATGKLGKPQKDVIEIVKKHKIGGVLLLNGTKTEFKQYVKELNAVTTIPLLYSADAEPSLINFKIKGTKAVKATSHIKDTAECRQIALTISDELTELGIFHNFAPVCDISTKNEAIGNRSFGSDTTRVMEMSEVFINASRSKGIMATAKHFPGHGYVKGDTHKKLVYIDGELKELAVYKYLIARDVPSIMVGHIAVRNHERYDTQGLPATCSRVIVTDLLRKELGFEGIIITDAMNMGAVQQIPNASLEAIKAGCDMILMPDDEEKLIRQVIKLMNKNPSFKEQVYDSVKRVLRYKVALGLL